MLRKIFRSKLFFGALACLASSQVFAHEIIPQPLQIVISVAEQKMVVLRDGGVVVKYPVSTSRFGLGDSFGSYKTPLGHLKVCDKVGEDLASGTVLKHRSATGEVLPVNAAGRDPIVTRILWLDGEDEQNRNAKARGIYIHGTTEEKRLGQPVSFGCIRMRSRDIIEIFDHMPVGTPVSIIAEKLPKLRKYTPPPPTILVKDNTGTPAAPVSLASNDKPAKSAKRAKDEHPVEVASGPGLIAGDPGAAQAMKGSILSAGLPEAGLQKEGSVTFHSWSKTSLREASNAAGPTGPR